MKERFFISAVLLMLLSSSSFAQEKWDLKRCVEYALANNISVKQQDVQARLAELQYRQGLLSRYPSASATANTGYSSGRNQNPVTFDLITVGYFFNSINLQANADIYNWNSKKNNIEASRYESLAASAGVDKLKNDISLNIAGAYLQALLSKEQANISEIQLKQTRAQLENTRKLVEAGSLPELNVLQLEAQLASDSAGLVSAQGNIAQALLLLKAYLNFDAGKPLEIAVPNIENIPLDDLSSLQPDMVYALAVKNLPQQRVNDLRIRAAEKFMASARGAMYPSVSLFGSLGTSFNDKATQVRSTTSVVAPVGFVTVNGTKYDVVRPFDQPTYGNIPYFGQLNENFRQSAGVSVSVPIAGGGALRTGYEKSKLNLKSLELQRELDNQKLKQDIYQAYTDVVTSLGKFNAATKTVEATQKAFEFASKRYDIGLLNTLDLITTQNSLYSAKLQRLVAQYDYVFKMKVLEFYKGQGLRL